MSKIKVVLWDIDGTLLNFLEAEKNAIRKCFEIFNLGECTDEMLKIYSEINKKHWEMLERGELTKAQVLEGRFIEFFTLYNINTSVIPDFNKEYQVQLGETICINDNGYELVRMFKNHVKQYAVTNGTKVAQDRKLKKTGLGELFDGVFISDEIGFEKPLAEFFEPVWNRIGKYEKDEILIVGDSLTSDIKGGNNIGIRCCWYNPAGIKTDLDLKIDFEIKNLKELIKILEI